MSDKEPRSAASTVAAIPTKSLTNGLLALVLALLGGGGVAGQSAHAEVVAALHAGELTQARVVAKLEAMDTARITDRHELDLLSGRVRQLEVALAARR